MSYINYELLLNKYPTGEMNEFVKCLNEFDIYHCLLAGNEDSADAVKKRITGLPDDFLKWLEVCDGGDFFFDITILTTKSDEFETYDDYPSADIRRDRHLSDDWFVFAKAIHSDVFFFDMSKKDGQVYQWDAEHLKIHASWATFEDWLISELNEALELIAEGELEPLGIKMGVDFG